LHKLSTISLYDEILVINQGCAQRRIVEERTHTELNGRDDIYASLYRKQFKEENGIAVSGVH
jgi:ABC-type multidrug transport system fused ATPase/permease subunit